MLIPLAGCSLNESASAATESRNKCAACRRSQPSPSESRRGCLAWRYSPRWKYLFGRTRRQTLIRRGEVRRLVLTAGPPFDQLVLTNTSESSSRAMTSSFRGVPVGAETGDTSRVSSCANDPSKAHSTVLRLMDETPRMDSPLYLPLTSFRKCRFRYSLVYRVLHSYTFNWSSDSSPRRLVLHRFLRRRSRVDFFWQNRPMGQPRSALRAFLWVGPMTC